MTFLLVQIKDTNSRHNVPFTAKGLGLFDDVPQPNAGMQIPYFVLVMQFSVMPSVRKLANDPTTKSPAIVRVKEYNPPVPSTSQAPTSGSKNSSAAARWAATSISTARAGP